MRVIMTGSSAGIGLKVAGSLLRKGHEVWGIARRSQKELAEEFPGLFHFSRADVQDWDDLLRAAAEVESRWAYADALVTCAGVQGEIGPLMKSDPGKWPGAIQVNLVGTYYAMRVFHPMLSHCSGRAKIVCFSGGGATASRANFSAYAASKAAVVRLVETVALELAEQPIDVNAIAPGAVLTEMSEAILAAGPDRAGEADYNAALRLAENPDSDGQKAVRLVEWLLSAQSNGISGRLLSALWDPWDRLDLKREELAGSDIYTLGRITPKDRGKDW